VSGRKKKQARKSYGSSGTPGLTSSSVDVVGTWMREEGGVLQKVVYCRSWWCLRLMQLGSGPGRLARVVATGTR
jgi:hypothetical protein